MFSRLLKLLVVPAVVLAALAFSSPAMAHGPRGHHGGHRGGHAHHGHHHGHRHGGLGFNFYIARPSFYYPSYSSYYSYPSFRSSYYGYDYGYPSYYPRYSYPSYYGSDYCW